VTTTDATPPVGELLRSWRHRRRLSQLDLAVRAEVSTRHLSFVETGRSTPSRELVLHLAEHLDVPLRQRNSLLLAAGYAPVYPGRPLDSAELAPVRVALDRLLAGHEPFPAVVVDRRWDLVVANAPALTHLGAGVDPALLNPPVNTLRLALHPGGLASRIVNLDEYASHLLMRLDREIGATGDPDLAALADELRSYPGVPQAPSAPHDPATLLFIPLAIDPPPGERGVPLRFFSTLTTFGTARDITVAELTVEAFFPADEATSRHLLAGHHGTASGRLGHDDQERVAGARSQEAVPPDQPSPEPLWLAPA
jgi:transcriptional regulator with XRE-family HTH domain